MSIAQNFPEIRPSLSLDFANTKKLDSRITFSRPTSAVYYDGQTVTKAEENLLTYSQEFDNASAGAWGVVSTSVSANTTVAPDGTTTADTVTASAGTALKYIGQAKTLSGTYTFSVYAKAGTHSIIQLFFGGANPAAGAFANFNIAAGSGVVGSSAGGTASIVDVGDGWYRCVFTGDLTGGSDVIVSFVNSTSATRAETTTSTGTIILWGAQLEQRSSVTAYTPTTTQPITLYQPALQTAASGVARFDHNPVTQESLGLLIEEQRTNLKPYSEQFDNASWRGYINTNTTVTPNQAIAPDGTLTADLIQPTVAGSAATQISSDVGFSASTTYTFSCFYKLLPTSTNGVFTIYAYRTAGIFTVTVDLSAGTVTAILGSATIQDCGNGVYRVSATGTTGSSVAGVSQLAWFSDSSGDTSVFVWGAQLEAGAFPTSYIPTVASQVTRSADSASMTGTNFSSWFRQDEGTLYTEVFDSGLNPWAVSVSINDKFYFRQTGSTAFGVIIGDVGSGFTTTLPVKMIGTYSGNTSNSSANGLTVQTASNLTALPSGTILNIGNYNGAAFYQNGHIKKLAYYPQRLSNTNLQALTS